jgi:hypothetical protein
MEKNFEQRIQWYKETFPTFPSPFVDPIDGRLYGIWILGNDYRSKTGYHGSYPPNYLKRLGALFPEIFSYLCLHLFSGSLLRADVGEAFRLDMWDTYDPDYVGDFLEIEFERKFDIIVVDPPYTSEDAEHYGVTMINRNYVLAKCWQILNENGLVLWLDQVWPMYKKVEWDFCGAINIPILDELNWDMSGTINLLRSTMHRVRDVFIYQKVGEILTT